LLILGGVLLALPGCGGGLGKLYPVSGTVKYGTDVLNSGMVTFHPDESKGNKSKLNPSGPIKEGGKYSVQTNGKDGAPPGWYKVTVSTMTPPTGAVKMGEAPPPVKINPKYLDPKTTDLSVEVPGTGAFDLTVSP
jgi:hypothetical protein